MGGAGSAVAEALAAAGIVDPDAAPGAARPLRRPRRSRRSSSPTAGSTPRGIVAAVAGALRRTRAAASAVAQARRAEPGSPRRHPLQFRAHEPTRATRRRCSRSPTCSRRATTAQLAIDQVGIRGLRYPLLFADADGVAQPTIADCNVYVALPERPQGHAHVAAGRAARGARARRAQPPLSVASCAACSTRWSCCSRRPAAGSRSRSRSSSASRRRCRAWRACSTTRCGSSASSTAARYRADRRRSRCR